MPDAIPPYLPGINLGGVEKYVTKTQTVKIATNNLFIEEPATQIEAMTSLMFEDIGGFELINISRHDMLRDAQITYGPISNVANILTKYKTTNIVSMHQTGPQYFNNFPINIYKYIPYVGNGTGGTNVYTSTDDIVIDLINITNERVDIEFISFDSVNMVQY